MRAQCWVQSPAAGSAIILDGNGTRCPVVPYGGCQHPTAYDCYVQPATLDRRGHRCRLCSRRRRRRLRIALDWFSSTGSPAKTHRANRPNRLAGEPPASGHSTPITTAAWPSSSTGGWNPGQKVDLSLQGEAGSIGPERSRGPPRAGGRAGGGPLPWPAAGRRATTHRGLGFGQGGSPPPPDCPAQVSSTEAACVGGPRHSAGPAAGTRPARRAGDRQLGPGAARSLGGGGPAPALIGRPAPRCSAIQFDLTFRVAANGADRACARQVGAATGVLAGGALWANAETTGCIPHFVGSVSLGVGVGPGLAGLVAEPEGIERGGVAEVVGSQLQNRFAGRSQPKFLGPLHPTVDLLDRRFNMAAGQRQPQASVLGVIHP